MPCPGVKACTAPQNAAIRSDTATTPRDSSPRPTSASKPPPRCGGAGAGSSPGAGPGPLPGSNRASAERMSSGERRRSLGYARSSFERLSPGTDDSRRRAPFRAEIVISRHPIRSGCTRSTNDSDRPDAGAENTASKRNVGRPPAPSRATTRCTTGRSWTLFPSSRNSSCRATLAAKPGRADAVAELEGRDLGEVEDVANVDAVACELDSRVVVDREVAERVRAGRARQREPDPDRGDERCNGLTKHGELLSRVRPRHVVRTKRASGSAGGADCASTPPTVEGAA